MPSRSSARKGHRSQIVRTGTRISPLFCRVVICLFILSNLDRENWRAQKKEGPVKSQDSQRAASESPALSASLHCRTVRLLSLCASAGSPILLQTARACPRSPNNHCLFTQPVSLFGHHQWLALGSVRITGPVPHTDLRALGSCSVALHARVRRAVDEKLR